METPSSGHATASSLSAAALAPLAATGKLLALAGKPPQAEEEANLQRPKEVLEPRQVTALAPVVPGKFGVPAR